MLHQSAPNCTKLHQMVPSCTKLNQSAPNCTKLHQITGSCTNLHQITPSCTKLDQSAPSCTKLNQVQPICTKFHQTASICAKLHQTESIWTTNRTKVWGVNLKNFPENSREVVPCSMICDECCPCVWRAWTGNVNVLWRVTIVACSVYVLSVLVLTVLDMEWQLYKEAMHTSEYWRF